MSRPVEHAGGLRRARAEPWLPRASERALRLGIAALALAGLGIAALALAGLGIAGYPTYARYPGARLFCSTGGCETVQSSPYAEVLGVPVAVLGVAGYLPSRRRGGPRGSPASQAQLWP